MFLMKKVLNQAILEEASKAFSGRVVEVGKGASERVSVLFGCILDHRFSGFMLVFQAIVVRASSSQESE